MQVTTWQSVSHYVLRMGEFLGELILKAVSFVVGALAEFICVQTATIVLPVVSFGSLTTHNRFVHPPSYGERRPMIVGPLASTLFGVALWTFAVVALVALVR
jgi:hypothetical protein